MQNKIVAFFAAFSVLLLLAAPGQTQQGWTPNRPITIISHYGPGASFTVYARGIAPYLSKELGVPVQVQTKTGADGVLGTTYVWRAKPDGYTLGMIDVAKMVVYNLVKEMEFDTRKFAWITNPASLNFVIAVPAKSPWRTVQDLKAAGEQKPIRQAAPGVGRNEIIPVSVLGIKHTNVINQTGGAETIMMMLRGEADVTTVSDSMLMPYFKSGDLRPILTFGEKRNKLLAANGFDVPSSGEVGFDKLNALTALRGIAAPPNTPKHVIAALDAAFTKAYQDPELIAWAKKTNNPLDPENAEEVRRSVEAMYALFEPWKELLARHIGK